MADAYENVVLKIALEVENNRLGPLDTKAAMQSIDEVKTKWDQAVREMEQRAAALRLPTAQFGTSASSLSNAATGATAGGLGGSGSIDVNSIGPQKAGESWAAYSARVNEAVQAQSNFTTVAKESTNVTEGLGKSAYDAAQSEQNYARLTNEKIKLDSQRRATTLQVTEATQQNTQSVQNNNSQQEKATGLTVQHGRALINLSTVAISAELAYRGLTQINGEHVNVLGKLENAFEKTLIGTALVGRGAGSLIEVFTRFGVTLTASSAALIAVPLAVAAGLIYKLAEAQAEANRQQEIGQALTEKLIGMNHARLERQLADEKQYTDAVSALRLKLVDQQSQRFGRRADVRLAQIGLEDDPQKRAKQLADEFERNEREIRSRNIRVQGAEGRIDVARATGRETSRIVGKPYDESQDVQLQGALKERKALEQEIVVLKEKQTQIEKEQIATVKESTQKTVDALKVELRRVDREEKGDRGTVKDRIRHQIHGTNQPSANEVREEDEADKYLTSHGVVAGHSTSEIQDQIQKLEQDAKDARKQLVDSLKGQLESEAGAKDELEKLVDQQESTAEAQKTYFQTMTEVAKDLKTTIDKQNQIIEQLRSGVTRRAS